MTITLRVVTLVSHLRKEKLMLVNPVDIYGKIPPLCMALSHVVFDCEAAPAETLAIFEKQGADVFARDKLGKGLLHIAAKGMSKDNKD